MRIGKHNKAVTIAELIIAMAIMVIIMAAIMPQFRAIQNSWATSETLANITQNGRVLEEHMIRNISTAKQITSVSASDVTEGFITFENADGNSVKYMFSSGYVLFGPVGSEVQLAGPVSRFQVSCYTLNDFDTPTTEANDIRLVEVETDFTNSNPMGTDRTFFVSAYLRTNENDCDIVGEWRLDDISGTVATDSSIYHNNGTLYNGPIWSTGQVDGALTFDGINDYVSLPIGSVINSLTNCTVSAWVKWDGSSSEQRVWDFGTGTTRYMFLTTSCVNGKPRFGITTTGGGGEEQITAPSPLPTDQWHHMSVTIDADNHIHKMYIDGSYVAQNTSGNLDPHNLGNTNLNYLARSNYAANPYFKGSLDDIHIHDRVLSEAEIARLANPLRYSGWDDDERKGAFDVTSIDVPVPTGTIEGDLLIAAVATDGSTTISAPGGWTEIDQGAASGEVTLGAWYKIAGSSEPANYTFTWLDNQQTYAWMMGFRGADVNNPINTFAFGTSAGTSNPACPSVTTTVNNCIILHLGAFDGADIIVDDPGLPPDTNITMDKSCGEVIYEGGATAAGDKDCTSFTIEKPSDTNTGDLLIAAVATDGNNLASLSPPSGWTVLEKDSYGTEVTLGTWYKIAGASEPANYTFTWSNSEQVFGYILRFTGHDPNDPINASAKNKGGNTYTPLCPSVTTTVDDTIIFRIGGFDYYYVYVYPPSVAGFPSDHTGLIMDRSRINSMACSGGAAYKTQASPGPSGTANFNLERSEQYVTVTFAVAAIPGTSGMVSGGAGYFKKSLAGNTGTADFSLTAPQEASMITVAINPDATSDDDCLIRP